MTVRRRDGRDTEEIERAIVDAEQYIDKLVDFVALSDPSPCWRDISAIAFEAISTNE